MIAIIRFELARNFHAISTYIYFAILAALAYVLMIAAAGAFQSASVIVGGGGKVMANSPFTIAEFISLLSYFGLLIISATCGKIAFQDFEYQTHSFFFTAPISKGAYLGGRFAASILVVLAIFSGIAVGLAVGTWMPFVDKARLGPNHLWAYVQPYLISVIPNVLVMGALFFSLAALTRRILPVYMTSVILLVGYLIAISLSAKLDEKFLAALLDPFGQLALDRVTQYWTISEKNVRLVSFEGALLWNRLLWMGVAAAIMAFAYVRFKFVFALEGRRAPQKEMAASEVVALRIPTVTREFSTAAFTRALVRLTRLGFTETVKNVYFAVIVLAGVLFMIAASRNTGDIYGTPTYPVTYQMFELVGGSFGLFTLIIITFYSGELVWRERDARTNELIDALPLPNWVLFLSKLFALDLVMVLLSGVVMLTCMAIQLAKGYTHLEPLLYIKVLFGLRLIDYLLLSVLAIAVQILVNNKYMGHFVMVLYYLSSAFMGQLGFEHHLYRYTATPGYTYSDMNGFGHFLGPVFWFDAYWAVFAVLLALLAHLYSVRGLATEWGWRSALARERFQSRQRWIAAAAAAACIALGGFIFYNTNVLNIYRTQKAGEKLRVSYEKEYQKYRSEPQPRITAVKLEADVYPQSRSARIRGHYEIANRTSQPVETVLVRVPEEVTERHLQFTPAATLQSDDRPRQVAIYRMTQPLPAGATGSLDFELADTPHGFQNDEGPTSVVYNGTFFNSFALPHFGYDEGEELSDDNTRRKYGLPVKERMADLHDLAARRDTYISNDSDWIDFDAILSTSGDQIAIAPGELVREWNKDGRNYFEYRTLKKILDFASVLSARYKVMRDHWHDVRSGNLLPARP